MKYYKITCGTPFLGEENDFYESGLSIEDLHERGVINECLYETGNEWYDEQTLEENDMFFLNFRTVLRPSQYPCVQS